MLAQRRRRWANIRATLVQDVVFAGNGYSSVIFACVCTIYEYVTQANAMGPIHSTLKA